MQRYLYICTAILLWGLSADAAEIPKLTGPVNDYGSVLTDAQEKQLTEHLLSQEKETGSQIVILTIDSLDGETVETFAEEVFASWKLGQAGKDNGVLIVAAMKDRKMRIEVGFGFEAKLTDALCGQIIRKDMVPRFKEKDYAGGLSAAITSINQAVKGMYLLDPAVTDNGMTLLITIIIVVVVIILLVGFIEYSAQRNGTTFIGNIDFSSSGGSSGSSGGGGGYSGGGGGSGGGGASGSW